MSTFARRKPRAGFSLFEILLALALLAVTMAFIGQLSSIAYSAVRKAELEAEGALICQTLLAEYASGVRTPGETPWQIEPRNPRWEFETRVRNLEMPHQQLITVSVRLQREPGSRVSLARMLRRPRGSSGGPSS